MPLEGLQAFDDKVYIVSAVWVVHLIYIYRVNGVEFQNVVVYPHQRVVHLLTMDHRRVAQHTHLSLRTILVSQPNGVVDDFSEVRMTGRLTVAGKGQHIGQLSLGTHLLQLLLKFCGHLLAGRHRQGGAMVLVEAALAVDTVEAAHLAVGRQQVDTE